MGLFDLEKQALGSILKSIRGGKRVTDECAKVIGLQKNLTIQCTELVALEETLNLFVSSWSRTENQGIRRLNIFSDCKSALQALQNPRRQSGQGVLRRIVQKIEGIRVAKGPEIVFQWVPAHSKVERNERADGLARSVTTEQARISSSDISNTSYVTSRATGEIKA